MHCQLKNMSKNLQWRKALLEARSGVTMTSVEDIVKELDEETVASLVDKMALFDVSRKFQAHDAIIMTIVDSLFRACVT